VCPSKHVESDFLSGLSAMLQGESTTKLGFSPESRFLAGAKETVWRVVSPLCGSLPFPTFPGLTPRLTSSRRVAASLTQARLLYFCNIWALNCSLWPLGTLSDFHSAPFQCFARNVICPAW